MQDALKEQNKGWTGNWSSVETRSRPWQFQRFLFRPFRAFALILTVTQGVALSWYVVAFQAALCESELPLAENFLDGTYNFPSAINTTPGLRALRHAT